MGSPYRQSAQVVVTRDTERRRLTVILNKAAGAEKAETLGDRIASLFATYGIISDVHVIEGGTGIAEIVTRAKREGSFAVAVGGGDGTVSAVASLLVDSACPLGILPLGTLNHFAKDLGIPLDLDAAAGTIASGRISRVDVGEVNGRVFVNNSSLGLYPSMVRGRQHGQRLGRSKWTALFWSTVAALRRYPLVLVRLTSSDGFPFTRRTSVVFIGNNEYQMKGFEIGTRPFLDRGRLAVYVARQDGPAALIRMAVEAVAGRLRHGVDFDFLRTETLQIEAAGKMIHVATDGEIAAFPLPLLYRIRPLALRVIVPVAE
jgi:diacylglycerol kinase family enzyme